MEITMIRYVHEEHRELVEDCMHIMQQVNLAFQGDNISERELVETAKNIAANHSGPMTQLVLTTALDLFFVTVMKAPVAEELKALYVAAKDLVELIFSQHLYEQEMLDITVKVEEHE